MKEGEIPHVSYHRKCRSLFTMKRDLESISQTTATASQIPEFNMESEEQRPHREEPSTSRTYPKICIFRQKMTAYKKRARTRDPLTQCVDLRADASIRKAAIAAGDGRIIGLAPRDLVPAEAWYHDQCYRDYTRPDSLRSSRFLSFPFPGGERTSEGKSGGAPGVSKNLGRSGEGVSEEGEGVGRKGNACNQSQTFYRTPFAHERGAIVQFDWLVARQSKSDI